VPGAKVTWSLPDGGSMAVQLADADNPMTGTADDRGRNYAVWRLGLSEGTQVAQVKSGLTGAGAIFETSATALHVLAASAGGDHVCAVLTNHRVACWGGNRFGQLGTSDTVARAVPTMVPGLPEVLEVRAGQGSTTCARDIGGGVWCWGNNRSGQVGPGSSAQAQLAPVRVPGVDGSVSVSLGSLYTGRGPLPGYTCAAFMSGGASCWGDNSVGELGTGDTISSATPRAVLGSGAFRSVYAAAGRSCAIDTEYEVWCWGDARYRELAPLPNGIYWAPLRPVPGFRFFSMEMTAYAQCGLQLAGIVSCWGDAFKYGLGISTWTTPDFETGPVRPELHEPIAQLVSNGGLAVYVRSRTGDVFMWGGLGNDNDFAPAVLISEKLRVAEIAGSGSQTCMISVNGGLYCGTTGWWGYFGYLGGSLRGVPDSVDS